ncbi:MAG: NAD-dependent epimerase/dehydratase family protein [Bacteroidetes bacterium]|nr:NAD-dependent epimerase/dehydratase family protein [Bacteroidota bacterium]
MKIAVTGASGHLGNVICRQLLGKGFGVKAMFNSFETSLAGLQLELFKGNILNRGDLKALFSGCDAVINCAAIYSINGDPSGLVYRTNTEGPKNVLLTASELGIKRIIHVSSAHAVMEGDFMKKFDETRNYKNVSNYTYDFSKAEGEKIMLNTQIKNKPEIIVLRPSLIVGPFDFKPSEIGKALIQFYQQKIPLLPTGGYDFIDVRDVANAAINALTEGRSNEVYLISGKYYSMKELAAEIREITGKKVPKRVIPYWALISLVPILRFYSFINNTTPLFTIESIDALKYGHPNMDCSKAKRELGHFCRPLRESLRDFYKWHQLKLSN